METHRNLMGETMGALARLFFDARQAKQAATQSPTTTVSAATDAAGKAFAPVADPQDPKPKPGFNPEPWQQAERA